jgi:hypothetical protein
MFRKKEKRSFVLAIVGLELFDEIASWMRDAKG